MLDNGIYARQGELVRCEKNHIICEIARDVKVGHYFKATDLINWTQDAPKSGASEDSVRCVTCGGKFWQSGKKKSGQFFRFIDGWRTSDHETREELNAVTAPKVKSKVSQNTPIK